MVKIIKLKAKAIKDSGGKLTPEVVLETGTGKTKASVPSGVSKGKYEAVEKEAKKAVKNVNEIIEPKLKGKDVFQQEKIDKFLIKLDGTKNKSRLGANALLAVSIAVLRAGAKAKKVPLWKYISQIAKTKPGLVSPAVLMIEGGKHSKAGLPFQEFMLIPEGKTFKEKLGRGIKIYQRLGRMLKKKYGRAGLVKGAEGAFTPPLKEIKKVLDLLMLARGKDKAKIIIDAAASYLRNRPRPEYYLGLAKEYPILAIEDPFSEKDWSAWKALSSKLLIIGDDLTVTNPERIRLAERRKACKGVIIKPNQIGTFTETILAARLAKSYGWKVMVSHRAGETKDDFIADLAVGLGADYIKAGAPSRPERMVKYKRLLEIEREIKKHG